MCRLHVARLILATIAAALVGLACSDGSDGTSGTGNVVPPAGFGDDAGTSGALDSAGSSGPTTTFRLAHLSPDLPGIDFCYRNAASDTWVGPVLGATAADAGGPAVLDSGSDAAKSDAEANDSGVADGALSGDAWQEASLPDASAADAFAGDAIAAADASALDGAAANDAASPDASAIDAASDAGVSDGAAGAASGALPYRSVTGYASAIGSGTFDIALIAAGSAGCSSAIATAQVTLDAGKRTTIAIVGRAALDAGAGGALAIVAFTDDPSASTSTARVRFVNAALGDATQDAAGPLAASLASGDTNASPIEIAADVEPAHAATPTSLPPVIDPLGYHDESARSGASAVLLNRTQDAWPSPWSSAPADLALVAGSIHTAFIVSGTTTPLAVVWCNDTASATTLTPCTTLEAAP